MVAKRGSASWGLAQDIGVRRGGHELGTPGTRCGRGLFILSAVPSSAAPDKAALLTAATRVAPSIHWVFVARRAP